MRKSLIVGMLFMSLASFNATAHTPPGCVTGGEAQKCVHTHDGQGDYPGAFPRNNSGPTPWANGTDPDNAAKDGGSPPWAEFLELLGLGFVL